MDQNLHALCTYESGLAHKTGTPHQLSIFVHDNIGVHGDALVTLTSILNRMLSMDPVIALSSVSPEQF